MSETRRKTSVLDVVVAGSMIILTASTFRDIYTDKQSTYISAGALAAADGFDVENQQFTDEGFLGFGWKNREEYSAKYQIGSCSFNGSFRAEQGRYNTPVDTHDYTIEIPVTGQSENTENEKVFTVTVQKAFELKKPATFDSVKAAKIINHCLER